MTTEAIVGLCFILFFVLVCIFAIVGTDPEGKRWLGTTFLRRTKIYVHFNRKTYTTFLEPRAQKIGILIADKKPYSVYDQSEKFELNPDGTGTWSDGYRKAPVTWGYAKRSLRKEMERLKVNKEIVA